VSAGESRDVDVKLQAARTRLVLDQPFMGALLLHLPMQATNRCETIGTDGVAIHFNPRYIAALSLRQTQFMLAHQALHCALGHFARRGHRTRNRWDVACDFAVNLLLADEGMEPPAGALLDSRYRGLSAEEIYPLIAQGAGLTTLDVHLFDGASAAAGMARIGDGGERERSATERDDAEAAASDEEQWSDAAPHRRRNPGAATAETGTHSIEVSAQQWQMRLASAAQQADRAGRLGASWQRALGRMLQPALPWSALLARHVVSRARDDYSFQRPSRRDVGGALLPRMHSAQLDLFVVLDTSGSVSESQLNAFAAEIEALKGQVRARVTLHACDEKLAQEGPWVFESWEPIDLSRTLTGGGGTDFRPVFDWIRDQSQRPDLLIYFTDAEGDFPQSAPPFPVIWLVKGPAPVPWGERIQLN